MALTKVIFLIIIEVVFIENLSAKPALKNVILGPTDGINRCATISKVDEDCQRCAKVTKSNVVYPMCCTEKDDAYIWCRRYLSFGIQKRNDPSFRKYNSPKQNSLNYETKIYQNHLYNSEIIQKTRENSSAFHEQDDTSKPEEPSNFEKRKFNEYFKKLYNEDTNFQEMLNNARTEIDEEELYKYMKRYYMKEESSEKLINPKEFDQINAAKFYEYIKQFDWNNIRLDDMNNMV